MLDSRETCLGGIEKMLYNLISSYNEVVSALNTLGVLTPPASTRATTTTAPDPPNTTPFHPHDLHLLLRPVLTPTSRLSLAFPALTSKHLMDLTQGDRLSADYAVEFRTLAERSGWDQTTLLACFQHGLSPRLRKELVFRGEKWTLSQFIETAVAMDCLARDREPCTLQVPDRQFPPCKRIDALQLSRGRLTTTERLRWIQRCLCLCCGESGGLRVQCPIRPEPQLSGILWCNRLSIPVVISWGPHSVETQTLVDLGAAGCLMDVGFAKAHHFPYRQ
ncbi:hypothetical protein Z043_115065 [Scleropages formosus]|uniref:Retrotransposon gag domain-containing protein n=1 Tax=Scleropages formosus TaxID=113540 RepID=A0A0P7YH79_SCLFO|nr:hypothetical protein Z043_115065 [Scleropages formosus]